ncbi:MAG: nitroreductase/quinone reductase family protein [Myxococcota bacterium]
MIRSAPGGGLTARRRGGRSRRLPWRAALLALLAASFGCGPIGPFPGGPLFGDESSDPVESWDFAKDYPGVQIETRPESPYSVNTWCLVVEGRLYVPSGKPRGKRWIHNVLADDRVRIRVGHTIYLARAVRVRDPEERRAVIEEYVRKYNVPDPDDPAASREVWFFRIEPREPG